MHASKQRTVLLACALLALVVWTVGTAAEPDKQGEYSCDSISKLPREQQCSFLRDKCQSESVVPYAEWYFCNVAPHNVLLRSMYIAAVCCLLPLAFCLLGDTAEFYIAPIMAHVSQAIPKMRPRFAGVTFVALGNGAPDLSANIAAISAGEVVLSAGAFTGAAMFVQCVVAAELVSLAGDSGIKCGGAMLRDVGVYCLAICTVLLAFSLGQISRAFVGWAIALYIMYMIWVFVGDEWHQRGRPKPQLDAQSFKALLTRIASRGGGLADDGVAAGAQRRRSSAGASSGRAAVGYTSRDDLEESLLPWVVAEDEEAGNDVSNERVNSFGMRPASGLVSLPPPEFEATQPSPSSTGGLRYSGGGGPGFSGPVGSRLGSVTSQSAQQRSTEMSAAATGGFRGGSGTPIGDPVGSQGGGGSSSRRLSAPSGAAAHSSSGDGSSTGAGVWAASPDGVQRHASLPSTARMGAFVQQQQGSGYSGRNEWGAQRQQQGAGGLTQRHAGGSGHPHLMNMGKQSFIDPKTYKQLVWADLADDEEEEARLEREIARQLIVGAGRSRPATAAGTYQPPSMASAAASPRALAHDHQQQQQQQQQPMGIGGSPSPRRAPDTQQQAAQQQQQSQGTPEAGAFLNPFGSDGYRTGPNTPRSVDALLPGVQEEGEAGQSGKGLAPGWQAGQAGFSGAVPQLQHLQQQYDQQSQQQLSIEAEGLPGSSGDVWQQLQWQVTLGNSEEWADAGPVRQLFRKVTFPLLLPAYLGQRLTIPFASAAGYSREWLIVSLLCFPLALIGYLGLVTLPGVLTACSVGVAAAVLGAVLTAWDQPGQMAAQGLGGKVAAAAPGVLAVLAFCMGVVWIDTIATEVVGIITFLAGLASLPSGVMGLTLLAWGNSLGDYFGNRAMARAGHTSTAITACFAAPLFNMLISLACGFSSYLHKLGVSSVKVTLTPEVALGCMFLIGYNIAIILVGKCCGWRLPPWFRHFARAWYGLYFTLAVASGFYQQHSSQTS